MNITDIFRLTFEYTYIIIFSLNLFKLKQFSVWHTPNETLSLYRIYLEIKMIYDYTQNSFKHVFSTDLSFEKYHEISDISLLQIFIIYTAFIRPFE